MPDSLVSENAQSVPPFSPYSGLYEHAFETIYKLNMGGNLITPDNDTLGINWNREIVFQKLHHLYQQYCVQRRSY
jgi:hypothetical protein